jgi:hypothetical protein
MMIHHNLKMAGPQALDKSFGLPAGASREQIREAAGKLLLQQHGLDGKYSKLDEKAVPEVSQKYNEFVGRQIKDRLRLSF